MAHSYKKAFVTCSKRMADNVHSIVRQKVHSRLNVMNALEPQDDDLGIIDCDVDRLGLEDWGTKLGLEFEDNPEWDDARKEMRRK